MVAVELAVAVVEIVQWVGLLLLTEAPATDFAAPMFVAVTNLATDLDFGHLTVVVAAVVVAAAVVVVEAEDYYVAS